LSGGLTQDDRVSVRISTTGGAVAHVKTQAATKVHSMERGFALNKRQPNWISVGESVGIAPRK
jgi:urease accessory protein UreH